MPKKCPVCGEPVMNNFYEKVGKREFSLEKTCNKKLDHIFFCASKKADDANAFVVSLSTRTKDPLSISWFPENKTLYVAKKDLMNRVQLPYFEPDFSNLRKLIKKIKTYLVFS